MEKKLCQKSILDYTTRTNTDDKEESDKDDQPKTLLLDFVENPIKYHKEDYDLDFDFYPCILRGDNKDLIKHITSHLMEINPKIVTGNRRLGTIFGDCGTYKVKYWGKIFERKVWPWETIPVLTIIKEYVEKVCNQKFEMCLIQYYRSGKIGIVPHRDNILKRNISIVGLSLGQTRTFVNRAYEGDREISTQLTNGSLYAMNPPTNDRWTHSIPIDETAKKPRISLTFRNF